MTSQSRLPSPDEINELERLLEIARFLQEKAAEAMEKARAYEREIKARMPLPLLDREGR